MTFVFHHIYIVSSFKKHESFGLVEMKNPHSMDIWFLYQLKYQWIFFPNTVPLTAVLRILYAAHNKKIRVWSKQSNMVSPL